MSRFLSTEGIETCFSYCILIFLYKCRIFGKGDPCLELSTAVSARSGTRRPQPAATRNKLPGMSNLKAKHNVHSQSRYLCVIHSCRPSTRSAPSRVPPRCHCIQILPTRHDVYQVLDIRRYQKRYKTALSLFFYKKLKNVSCEYDRVNG